MFKSQRNRVLKNSLSKHSGPQRTLQVETLEDRLMLSTVEIAAAGAMGTEQMQVLVRGEVVGTWSDIGGNADARQFFNFSVEVDGPVSPGQVQVQFTNDLYDPDNNIDRNLIVDDLRIDGVLYETEDASVYSTGTWLPSDGISPGYGRGETLHGNGYFQYGEPSSNGSVVELFVQGEGGAATFNVLIDGQVAGTYSAPNQGSTIQLETEQVISADQLRIEFTGDQYDPANGIDINLVVDKIKIDGVTYETEDATVFSTGTWLASDGINPGFGRGETLHANGYFQFGATQSGSQSLEFVNEIGNRGTIVEFDSNSGRYLSMEGDTFTAQELRLHRADGSLLPSFGNNGVVDLSELTGLDPGNDFNIDHASFFPDGSMLLVARNFNFGGVSVPYLLKVGTDGTIDQSFQANGYFTESILGIAYNEDGNFDAVIGDAGDVTLIGNVFNDDTKIGLLRLNSNGQIDAGWGEGGTQTIDRSVDINEIDSHLLADGSVVVAFTRDSFPVRYSTSIAKIGANGFADTGFGDNGIATVVAALDYSIYSKFSVDSQERLILVGQREMARLNANGGLDSSFGNGGQVVFPQFENNGQPVDFDRITAALIDSSDRVVLIANNQTQTGKFSFNYDGTTVVRYGTDGTLDSSFDSDGVQSLNVANVEGNSEHNRMIFDADGNLVMSIGETGPRQFEHEFNLSRFRFA